ncbi:hypothetical protein AGMMS49579_22090 [Spirochaetia bacterium]|nr:hypothetical protein AGMMS49579_22090 [Spirochaetia bacterium]
MAAIDDITNLVLKKLDENIDGLRWADLYSAIKMEYPNMKNGTVVGGLRNFYNKNTNSVYKPDKGLYRLTKYQNNGFQINAQTPSIKEEDFYESFAAWLVNDQEECTKAKELGGSVLGSKWGTPDVIGVSKSLPTDIIEKEIEITSAEIKLSQNELITAFGQSCSYKLFSHKVYLVIPQQSNAEEISRLDSLCFLFGIGLVLFDNLNPNMPNYQLKNRAQRGEPDNYYLNKNIDKAKNFFNDLLS